MSVFVWMLELKYFWCNIWHFIYLEKNKWNRSHNKRSLKLEIVASDSFFLVYACIHNFQANLAKTVMKKKQQQQWPNYNHLKMENTFVIKITKWHRKKNHTQTHTNTEDQKCQKPVRTFSSYRFNIIFVCEWISVKMMMVTAIVVMVVIIRCITQNSIHVSIRDQWTFYACSFAKKKLILWNFLCQNWQIYRITSIKSKNKQIFIKWRNKRKWRIFTKRKGICKQTKTNNNGKLRRENL